MEYNCQIVSVQLEREPVRLPNGQIRLNANGQPVLTSGFSIGGGSDQNFEGTIYSDHGIYVTKIQPNGPAFRSGLRVHDRILQVNGTDCQMITHSTACQRLTSSNMLHILVGRNPQFAYSNFNQLPPPIQNRNKNFISENPSTIQENKQLKENNLPKPIYGNEIPSNAILLHECTPNLLLSPVTTPFSPPSPSSTTCLLPNHQMSNSTTNNNLQSNYHYPSKNVLVRNENKENHKTNEEKDENVDEKSDLSNKTENNETHSTSELNTTLT
ncbi:hypothetical protein SNEBB_006048 [Seison nebaliae]|nr:hypothetical protein SNEBB_006048 [Seison nebaliae]